jgi:hypothetical protein
MGYTGNGTLKIAPTQENTRMATRSLTALEVSELRRLTSGIKAIDRVTEYSGCLFEETIKDLLDLKQRLAKRQKELADRIK